MSVKGNALILTMLLLVVLTAGGIYAVSLSTPRLDAPLQTRMGAVTRNLAESGAYFGISQLPATFDNALSPYRATLTVGDDMTGTYTVTSRLSGPTTEPGYGTDFRFAEFEVSSTAAAPSGFSGGARAEATVSVGPMPAEKTDSGGGRESRLGAVDVRKATAVSLSAPSRTIAETDASDPAPAGPDRCVGTVRVREKGVVRDRRVAFVAGARISGGLSVIDLATEKEIWRLDSGADPDMRFPLVSPPVGVGFTDRANAGYTRYAYALDQGGQLWRFDFTAPGTWDDAAGAGRVTGGWRGKRIFVSSTHPSRPRRFFHRVDVAFDKTMARWILFGSGAREETDGTGTGRIYAVRDGDAAAPYSESGLADLTSVLGNSRDQAAGGTVDRSSRNGWFAALPGQGEAISSDPVVFNDVVYFTSFAPDGSAQGRRGGVVRLYGIRLGLAAAGTTDLAAGAGGLATPSGSARRVRSVKLDGHDGAGQPSVAMNADGGARLSMGGTSGGRVLSFPVEAPSSFRRLKRWKEWTAR